MMNIPISKSPVALCAFCLAAVGSAFAANNLPTTSVSNTYYLTNSATQYYITGETVTYPANVTIAVGIGNTGGPTSTNNHFLISEGGALETYRLYVGRFSANNALTVSGTTSYLKVTSSFLNIGLNTGGLEGNGSYNSLSIENGASVSAGLRLIIGQDAGASHNSLTVSGVGSALTVADTIQVGQSSASYNTLAVLNGATATTNNASTANMGVGLTNGTNNSLIVSGSGSYLSVNAVLIVGNQSGATTNSAQVIGGGTLKAAALVISSNSAAANNTVSVSGAGSLLTLSSALVIGNHASSGSSLQILNAAAAYAGTTLSLNGGAALTVDGIGSVVTVSGTATFGGTAAANVATLSLTNGGGLAVGGAFAFNKYATLDIDVSSQAAIQANTLAFAAPTDATDAQTVTLDLSNISAAGDYVIVSTVGGITGFDAWYAYKDTNLSVSGLSSALQFDGLSVDGNNLVASISAIPEPAQSAALLALLAGWLAVRGRRRK